jgi:hypothetical protein
VDYEVNVVLSDPIRIYSPRSVGNRLVHISASCHDRDALFDGQNWVTLPAGCIVVSHYPNDQIVAQGAGLFQKFHMSMMKQVGYHISIHPHLFLRSNFS